MKIFEEKFPDTDITASSTTGLAREDKKEGTVACGIEYRTMVRNMRRI